MSARARAAKSRDGDVTGVDLVPGIVEESGGVLVGSKDVSGTDRAPSRDRF